MRCVICRLGETQPGAATITLERGEMTLVVKAVPAQVCQNCDFLRGMPQVIMYNDAWRGVG